MAVATDYDDTFNTHPELRGEVDFIITGANWDEYDDIKNETNPSIPIFFNPGRKELDDIVRHKADIINRTGVTKFFENQTIQCQALRILCPKVKIVQVYDGRNAI